jgi:hypothetical protein
VELKGLANANFEQMSFTSGAGDYTLSFNGDLQRDASVTIDSGFGTVNIIVPEGDDCQGQHPRRRRQPDHRPAFLRREGAG